MLEAAMDNGFPNVCKNSLGRGCPNFLVVEFHICFILLRLFSNLRCIQKN